MRVAYEDIRIAPSSQLTKDLMSQTVEQELAADDFVTPEARTEAMYYHPYDGGSSDRGVGSGSYAQDPPNIRNPALRQAKLIADDEAPQIVSDTRTSSALLANNIPSPQENPEADIGTTSTRGCPTPHAELSSDKARVMEGIARTIGKAQVTRNRLEFAPPWIVREVFDQEHSSNWADAYVEIDDSSLPAHANVISSHVIYKVKTSEDGLQTWKARIVPRGNRDSEKDEIRKDSSTAQFDVIRILLAAVTFMGMRLALADIKGAYLQSGSIQRDIYVRPPREWKGTSRETLEVDKTALWHCRGQETVGESCRGMDAKRHRTCKNTRTKSDIRATRRRWKNRANRCKSH